VKTLILGGIRSGKSRQAERIASASGMDVVYIATAVPGGDPELHARIAAHRDSRPAAWCVVEEPLHLAAVIARRADGCLLIDCLTLWLTNLLVTGDEALIRTERSAMLASLRSFAGPVIFVSNETNMGVVPLGELSRRYCDEAGSLHQELAALCDRVVLMVAGLPIVVKGPPL
jgi:adenosylcobinamide kinase/adenosylcobinamide-phosphate guanylyltransferase